MIIRILPLLLRKQAHVNQFYNSGPRTSISSTGRDCVYLSSSLGMTLNLVTLRSAVFSPVPPGFDSLWVATRHTLLEEKGSTDPRTVSLLA